jgi:hypothetical protein
VLRQSELRIGPLFPTAQRKKLVCSIWSAQPTIRVGPANAFSNFRIAPQCAHSIGRANRVAMVSR